MEPPGGQSPPLLLTTGHKVPAQFLATVDTRLLSFKEGWRPPGSTHQGTGPTPASRLLHHTRGGNPQETVEAGLSNKDTKGEVRPPQEARASLVINTPMLVPGGASGSCG